MNGKDIFLGLGYIDSKFIEEAEKEELHPVIHSWKRSLLIAALVAIMLMLVGCSVAYAQGWFTSYFARNSDKPLSSGQVEYIAENEQVIGESQVQNEWTVELRSAINDGSKAMIIIGISAPEGINLEPEEVDGYLTETFGPGNGGMSWLNEQEQHVLTASDGIRFDYGHTWVEDGDGQDNTKNMVLSISPRLELCTADPFGENTEYYIHIKDIVREYEDEEYRQSLLDGKYKGQDAIMFEQDEIARMRKTDILVEGTWDFTVRFDESAQEIELLKEPITVMGHGTKHGEPINEIFYEVIETYEETIITSFILRPLSAEITYESDKCIRFARAGYECIYAVMKDGSQIELRETITGSDSFTMRPLSPLVLDEVDHILLPDGTKISMP